MEEGGVGRGRGEFDVEQGSTCLYVVLVAPLCRVVCVHPLRVTSDKIFRGREKAEKRDQIE